MPCSSINMALVITFHGASMKNIRIKGSYAAATVFSEVTHGHKDVCSQHLWQSGYARFLPTMLAPQGYSLTGGYSFRVTEKQMLMARGTLHLFCIIINHIPIFQQIVA